MLADAGALDAAAAALEAAAEVASTGKAAGVFMIGAEAAEAAAATVGALAAADARGADNAALDATANGFAVATGAGNGMATPAGADAGARGALEAAADAVPSLFRSLIFLDNSAARTAESLACLVLAIFSSVEAAGLPPTAPLDKVSLSGTVLVGARSSTLA